jgi:hypothetical protein
VQVTKGFLFTPTIIHSDNGNEHLKWSSKGLLTSARNTSILDRRFVGSSFYRQRHITTVAGKGHGLDLLTQDLDLLSQGLEDKIIGMESKSQFLSQKPS